MKKLIAGGALLGLPLMAIMAVPVQAQDCDTVLSFPLDTVIHNNPGKLITLGTIDTSQFEGGTGTARSQNQESVHPGNHLLIDTGVDNATLTDVEASPGVVRSAGPFTLGDTLTVTLELGPDGVFSGGGDIDVCIEDDPVPTTEPPTTDPPPTTTPNTDPPETTPPSTDPPATTVPSTDPPSTDPPATDPPEETTPPATDPPSTEPPLNGSTPPGETDPPSNEETPPPESGERPPPQEQSPPKAQAEQASKQLPKTGSEGTLAAAAALTMLAGGSILWGLRRRSQ